MSTTTTISAAEILHHTAAFLSQTHDIIIFLKRPHHHHHLMNLASQTLENAIATTSTSSLRLVENLLRPISTSNPAFSSFLLSIVHHLRKRPLEASISLLDMFNADPTFARLEIAPFLFEKLFLLHFMPLLEWYNQQRCVILSSYDDPLMLMSKMSGDQTSALKDLETDYQELLDENCRVFVHYFKAVLQNKDGDQLTVPPSIVLQMTATHDRLVNGEQEHIGTLEFGSANRRYNPIWGEGDEFNSTNKNKLLSKLPSFLPQRVSPKLLLNQTSLNNNNNDNYSSSDSEAEQEEEKIKAVAALFEYSISHKQNQAQESECCSMGKHTTTPKDFVCPITTNIFNDPVTLETGQTYERTAIQEWIDRGNSTCPITRHNLNITHLPKTNYVLKRLIASWQDKNPPVTPSEPTVKFKPVSSNSVISQSATMTELKLAITDLCTSEILRNAELAVLKIEAIWNTANIDEVEIQSMLVKPPVVNGFVEVLFNSVDKKVLRATVYLLTELGSRDDIVIQTLTRVDSDVECVVQLFKKGLMEAVVLVYLLRPSDAILAEMDIVDQLLEILSNDNDDDGLVKLCVRPKTASLIMLRHILQSSNEASSVKIVRKIVSTKAIEKIIASLRGEEVKEKIGVVSILLRCIMEDGKCRNIIAEKIELAPILECFSEVNDDERFEIVHFLWELVKLNRRNLNEQMLHILKDEGSFSTMHRLVVYLQSAPHDQSPIVAGLLLQLDLLDEPRKMSIYREEAVDTLISCLRNSEFPSAQICAAETILSLQGRFSYSGKSLSRAILLRRAGFDTSYRAFMRKDQRHTQDIIMEEEEEKAGETWERKVGFVLVSHEFGLVFEGLAEGLKSSKYDEELHSICFMTATWLIYMLSILPDTGIRGAARVCLLHHFVSIFKYKNNNTEDRALSMLALNTFIGDLEGLQDVAAKDMKDIVKGLRELKKSSPMAFEMLKVLSQEDIWTHKQLSQQDDYTSSSSSISGSEVVTITCFKAKIFSGHSDGTIKVWTINGRSKQLRLVQDVREHTKTVTSLEMMLHKLYSGSLDRTLRVWSVTEETIYCEQIIEMKDQINNLVVANTMASYIPQGPGIKVHSWNGSSKLLNQQKYVKCLALAQGKLYCGCLDNSIQEIDLVTGTLGNIQIGSKKLLGKSYPIYALKVNDGLIYSSDGTNVKIWSSSNYSMVGSLTSILDVRTMAVSSEHIYLGCKSGIIEVWCKKKHNRVETLEINSTAKILCMAIDTTEDMLVIGTSDGKIQTWGLS